MTRYTRITIPLLMLLIGGSCLGPLDTLGLVSTESNHESPDRPLDLADDRIEDKNQSCDPELMTAVQYGDCHFSVNMSCSVTRLDVIDFEEDQQALSGRLFSTRGAALDAITAAAVTGEAGGEAIPSMEVVNGTLKPFNDGLYAAIEIGAQDGLLAPGDATELYPSKRQFLFDLAAALDTADASATAAARPHLQSALVFVLGALLASGQDVSPLGIDSTLVNQAQAAADDFSNELLNASPMGFYTWSETLQEVFVQDRFLQNRGQLRDNSVEELGRFAAMAAVIEADPALRGPYLSFLSLYAGLTNPFATYSAASLFDYVDGVGSLENLAALRTDFLAENSEPYVCSGTWFALLPQSRARDTEYFNETYCHSDPAADVNLIDVLVNAIRDRLLDLETDETSGWYDYQLYALETLLVPESLPESDNLLLTKTYKEKLIETFQSLITQTRETHAKQLSTFGGVGSAAEPTKVDVYPKFPLEPFPSFYLRTARAYRFLETYLHAVLGPEFLGATYRLYEDDTEPSRTLAEELHHITGLMYGIYVLSARAVGLDPAEYLLQQEVDAYPTGNSADQAEQWLAQWKTDPDVLRDPRVIVPVGQLQTGETLYWAVLGVKVYRIHAEYVENFEPTYEPANYCEVDQILDHYYLLLVEEMQEVRIGGHVAPLTRDEFRGICDQHTDADDIVSALEGL